MAMEIKICGVRRRGDAAAAVAAGATMIGLNFYPTSPRYVTPAEAMEIAGAIPPGVARIGVFVNATEPMIRSVDELVGLDGYQLHGDETPELVESLAPKAYKAFRIQGEEDLAPIERYPHERFLLDSRVPGLYGGSGVKFDWSLAREAMKLGKVILAGGLNPDNVAEAVRWAWPWGVDVAGGVEDESGYKDPAKMEALVAAVREAERQRS